VLIETQLDGVGLCLAGGDGIGSVRLQNAEVRQRVGRSEAILKRLQPQRGRQRQATDGAVASGAGLSRRSEHGVLLGFWVSRNARTPNTRPWEHLVRRMIKRLRLPSTRRVPGVTSWDGWRKTPPYE